MRKKGIERLIEYHEAGLKQYGEYIRPGVRVPIRETIEALRALQTIVTNWEKRTKIINVAKEKLKRNLKTD